MGGDAQAVNAIRSRPVLIASAVGAILFAGWTLFFGFGLHDQPTMCVTTRSEELLFGLLEVAGRHARPIDTYGQVADVIWLWAVLLVVLGVAYLVAAIAARVMRWFERRSRWILALEGLLLVAGPFLVTLMLAWLVQADVLPRSRGVCGG